jgi:lipid-A-disaccharide synthase
MKYYLIVGEASGDLHASNLMRAILAEDKEAEFRYFGGDLMQAVGGTLVKHYREMAYMGFIPVLMNARTILRNMDLCKKDIEAYKPDRLILVDYPGFNLKIAKYFKTKSEYAVPRITYYISPKIWAWKTYRIKSIKQYIDQMLCILPFEVDFYKKYDYPISYVGNPTVDAVAEFKKNMSNELPLNLPDNKPIIALLAGSRRQEIKDNLPVMLQAALPFTGYQLVIAGAPGIEPAYYDSFIQGLPVSIVYNRTYALLNQSHTALVTSGTATLETALFRVPQAVCYKTPVKHIVSFVFKHFFSCPYISLVNLIADKTVVQELFGKYFSEQQVHDELNRLLNDQAYRNTMLGNYDEVIEALGDPGASERAARLIQ